MDVKRYDVDSDPQDGPCGLWEVEDVNGPYVRYEDYCELQKQLEAAEEQLKHIYQIIYDTKQELGIK